MQMSATPCLTLADTEKDYLLRCLEFAVKANEILSAENRELRERLGMKQCKCKRPGVDRNMSPN